LVIRKLVLCPRFIVSPIYLARWSHEASPHNKALKRAVLGMVKTQVQTIFLATPQWIAENFVTAPTPMIAPVMVWVVETGAPMREEKIIAAAEAVSALNP